jgi:hypothetical protein
MSELFPIAVTSSLLTLSEIAVRISSVVFGLYKIWMAA